MSSQQAPRARHNHLILLWTLALTLLLAGCGRDIQVPPAPPPDAAVAARQLQQFVGAMKPRRTGKPVIAVLARNEGTETTDFLLSHAVLQRSGVAQVLPVAPGRGRVHLYPALDVDVATDLETFDRSHPDGADYVVVPALDDADHPAINAWLRQQSSKGARIVGVCAGALILGRAGLLDGRRYVTHWYYRKDVAQRHPTATYVPHQRYVVDGNIATTTGITASMPAMLALVEAIGGRARAQALASEIGIASWTPAHDSGAFALGARRAASYLLAKAAFWRDEERRIDVADGMDDIALALVADAWSRTGHVRVAANAPGPVRLRSGLPLLAQAGAGTAAPLPLSPGLKPTAQLDRTLCEITARFGEARSEWVRMELEYPGEPACPA
jgi:putative intracellular protease/amidase